MLSTKLSLPPKYTQDEMRVVIKIPWVRRMCREIMKATSELSLECRSTQKECMECICVHVFVFGACGD